MQALETALAASGLCLRGVVLPKTDPITLGTDLKPEQGERVICLIGHTGGAFWPVFEAWHEAHPGIADPLDSWSKTVIRPIADAMGGEAVFPSDRPWQPFQQWAMAAEGLKPSPLGLLIHPCYGLWHGYRGAILLGAERSAGEGMRDGVKTGDVPVTPPLHPCDECAGKPCLSACPVEAFSASGFAVADCRSHLKTEAGRNGCMQSGCLARDACPVGHEYRYSPDQIRFHMAAFG